MTFNVEGVPAPQGSKRIGRAGRGPNARPILIDDNDAALKPWRALVAARARKAAGEANVAPLAGPVAVQLRFVLDRPKDNWGTGRNAGTLRPSAPVWPAVKPDVDKLARAVLDALTVAKVYGDDGQVVDLHLAKVYAGPDCSAGVRVTVMPLGGAA